MLVTAVIAVYTLAGGHKAVAATDLVQLGLIALVLVGWLWPAAAARADFSQLPAGLLHLPWPAQGGPWFALNMTVMMGLSGVVGWRSVFQNPKRAVTAGPPRAGPSLAAPGWRC